jgi:hypothetical protein
MRRCWECEREADRVVEAVLPLTDGNGPVIGLCPACFDEVYLALVDSLQDGAAAGVLQRAAARG